MVIRKLWRTILVDKRKNRLVILRLAGLVIAGVFISYGIGRGEAAIVLNKAVHICFECIGLG